MVVRPGVVAIDGDDRVGLLTYAERADGIAVVTIQALVRARRVAGTLMDTVHALAADRESSRIWLIFRAAA